MIKNEILLTSGHNKLSGLYWQADKPVAITILVHGLGEHIARYDHVADKFIENNISVLGVDLIGHGKSAGKRGHVKSIDEFYGCIEAMFSHIHKEENNLPLILYGHSMGGNIALNYLLNKDENKFCCALITSPWLRLAHKPNVVQLFLAKTMNTILPSLLQPNGLKMKDISSVVAVQNDYANDPLNHDKISVRLFNEVYKKGLCALENAPALTIPILIAHGEKDGITSPQGSEDFATDCPMATLKIWPGLRHETHNEHNNEVVIAYYIKWLLAQLG